MQKRTPIQKLVRNALIDLNNAGPNEVEDWMRTHNPPSRIQEAILKALPKINDKRFSTEIRWAKRFGTRQ